MGNGGGGVAARREGVPAGVLLVHPLQLVAKSASYERIEASLEMISYLVRSGFRTNLSLREVWGMGQTKMHCTIDPSDDHGHD